MKHIIVKDYLYEGDSIFGNYEETRNREDYYLLDDGDMFTIKQLKEERDCEVIEITSQEIIDKFLDKMQDKCKQAIINLCAKLDEELYFPVKHELEDTNVIHSLGMRKEDFKRIIEDEINKLK